MKYIVIITRYLEFAQVDTIHTLRSN